MSKMQNTVCWQRASCWYWNTTNNTVDANARCIKTSKFRRARTGRRKARCGYMLSGS